MTGDDRAARDEARAGARTEVPAETRARLRARLAAAPERVALAARAAEPRPVADGEWSAYEIVLHLAAVEEEVFHRRLRQLAEERDPHWEWTEPRFGDGFVAPTLDSALDVFRLHRAETLAHLDALDDAGWARTGTHATYGVLDVLDLVTVAADHDDDHLATLER